jgi:hypothetical protein
MHQHTLLEFLLLPIPLYLVTSLVYVQLSLYIHYWFSTEILADILALSSWLYLTSSTWDLLPSVTEVPSSREGSTYHSTHLIPFIVLFLSSKEIVQNYNSFFISRVSKCPANAALHTLLASLTSHFLNLSWEIPH